MFGRVVTLIFLAAAIALSLIFQSTNPVDTGPVGLLAVFFLLYTMVVIVTTWMIHGISKVLTLTTRSIVVKKPMKIISMTHAYYYASIVAFVPIILLAMGSVSSIGVYELILVAVFASLGVFYVKKRLE